MKLFAQIRKVDEAKRLVYGRAIEEVVDKSDEIMDYASSKPHFVKWSEDIAKDTDGKSLGNVRAMHGKVAAGKLTGIDFNDAEKAIDICAKVVDDQEWAKVLEGVYRGFSVGGNYVEGSKKVEKLDNKSVTRYTAKPNEISLVDSPCVPTSLFFEVQKADGSLAKVDFQAPAEPVVAAADPAADVTVDGSPDDVAELGKAMNVAGMSIKDVIAKISAPAAAVVAYVAAAPAAAAAATIEKLDAGALRKSMYTCASLAQTISSLQSLKSSAEYEAFYEGDTSGVAAKLGAVIALAGQVLIEMVQEEIAEAGEAPEVMEMAEKAGALAKVDADPFRALLKIGARNSKSDTERLATIHKMTVELGHDCAASKVAPAGDMAKVEVTISAEGMQKMVSESIEKFSAEKLGPLEKALTAANEQIKKLEAQPAPARVSLRAIAKSEDTGAPVEPAKPAVITDNHGDVHEAAGLIKSLHQSGGAPLLKL